MTDLPERLEDPARRLTVSDRQEAAVRIRQLEEALRAAMAYMPHGAKYAGPQNLHPEDAAAFERCRATLFG